MKFHHIWWTFDLGHVLGELYSGHYGHFTPLLGLATHPYPILHLCYQILYILAYHIMPTLKFDGSGLF